VPDQHRPTVEEAYHRLTQLREQGSTPHAFGLRLPVPPPA